MSVISEAFATWRTVRADFETYREGMYRRASDDLGGVLLNREARERGIDSWSLFIGSRRRAERWASEELIAWWRENGRMTYAEFEAQAVER